MEYFVLGVEFYWLKKLKEVTREPLPIFLEVLQYNDKWDVHTFEFKLQQLKRTV